MWNRKRKETKVEKAVVFLQQQIEDLEPRGHYQLPSVQQLSVQAKVSPVTMHRALQELIREGLLTAAPRRGIQIVARRKTTKNHNEAPAISEKKKYKWELIKEQIINDILQGKFGSERILPSKKVLCTVYNVSFQTVAKTIEVLLAEQWIRPYRKGYAFNVTSESMYGTIVIIAPHYNIDCLAMYAPHMHHFFSSLEREQKHTPFKLLMLPFRYLFTKTKDQVINRTTIEEIEAENMVIGYIIVHFALQYKEIDEVMHLFHRIKKPIAIFDNEGFSQTIKYRFPRNVRIFSIGTHDSKPGKDLARYLLSCGHRHFAYFVTYPEPEWSQIRYSGIKTILNSSGLQFSIQRFCYSQQNRTNVFSHNLAKILPIVKNLENMYVSQHYTQPLEAFLESRQVIIKMFHEALTDKAITAWIMPHDKLALHAYYFLRRNGIKIPQRIALCSFDNSFESFGYGITSFDFNAHAAVRAILDYLFAPTIKNSTNVIKIPGTIMKRETTEQDSCMSTFNRVILTPETGLDFRSYQDINVFNPNTPD